MIHDSESVASTSVAVQDLSVAMEESVTPTTTTPVVVGGSAIVCTPIPGLSSVKSCIDVGSISSVVVPLVVERFTFSPAQQLTLVKELTFYFQTAGISNEHILSVMTDDSKWPLPSTIATIDNPLTMVNVPVTLLLSQIAVYTEYVLNKSLFLAKDITFGGLKDWFEKEQLRPPNTNGMTNNGRNSIKSINENVKIPVLMVPKFQGDIMGGDTYIEDVERAFRSKGLVKFLHSKTHCDSCPTWSDAFASMLRESVANSPIMGYLSTELENVSCSFTVWAKFRTKLSTGDVLTARIMSQWQSLFGL